MWILFFLAAAVASCLEQTWEITRVAASPDGFTQPMILVNGQYPGPTLYLTVGEEAVIHLVNHMEQQSTTLHFHGVLQRGSPWADGTRGINQCPVQPKGGRYTYRFFANEAGTHWYHSHVDYQIENGMAGVIVVRDPTEEYYVPLEREVPILLQDWMHGTPMDTWLNFKMLAPSLQVPSTYHAAAAQTNIVPESMVIHGRANYDCAVAVKSFNNCTWRADYHFPNFDFVEDNEYRLRFVGGGGNSFSPMEVCMGPDETMRMTLIAADGNLVQPVRGSCFQINAGQRIDVLWRATVPNRELRGQWLRVRTLQQADHGYLAGYAALYVQDRRKESVLGSCKKHCGDFDLGRNGCSCTTGCERFGDCCFDYAQWCLDVPRLFQYDGEDEFEPIYRQAFIHELDFENRDFIGLEVTPPQPYVFQTTTTYGMADFNDTLMLKSDNPDPLLMQWYHGKSDFPPFVKWIERGTTVDWLFVNEGSFTHPLHYHGYKFYLLGSEYGSAKNPAVFNRATARLNYDTPPMRDTVDLPSHGWTLLRWVADNPGTWIIHCHVEAHVMMGMGFVVMVGDKDPNDPSKLIASGVPAPPVNFTYCANPNDDCTVGSLNCPCTLGKGCDEGLVCKPRWPDTDNDWNVICVPGTKPCDASSTSTGPSPTASKPPTRYPTNFPTSDWFPTQTSCVSTSDCDASTYCSPNLGSCLKRKPLYSTCNAVQLCESNLKCVYNAAFKRNVCSEVNAESAAQYRSQSIVELMFG